MKGFTLLKLLDGTEMIPVEGGLFSINHAQDRTVIGFSDGTVFVPTTAVAYAVIAGGAVRR